MGRAWLLLVVGCSFAPRAAGVGDDASFSDGHEGGSGSDSSNADAISRRIDVTGTVTGGPHADFPLLVALTDPALRDVAAGGEVASPQGVDLWFSLDDAGATPLAFELERYAGATGDVLAWVKLPSLATASSFYVHYGDASITTSRQDKAGVWSNGFAGVWHLGDATDATGTNATTDSGTQGVDGQIAGARQFSTDILTAGSGSAVADVFDAGGTAEAWFDATSSGGGGFGRIFDKGPSNTVMSMCDSNVPGALLFGHTFSDDPGNWCTPQDSVALGAWTYVAVVYDSSSSSNTPRMFVNGVGQTVSAVGTPSGSVVSDAQRGPDDRRSHEHRARVRRRARRGAARAGRAQRRLDRDDVRERARGGGVLHAGAVAGCGCSSSRQAATPPRRDES